MTHKSFMQIGYKYADLLDDDVFKLVLSVRLQDSLWKQLKVYKLGSLICFSET